MQVDLDDDLDDSDLDSDFYDSDFYDSDLDSPLEGDEDENDDRQSPRTVPFPRY